MTRNCVSFVPLFRLKLFVLSLWSALKRNHHAEVIIAFLHSQPEQINFDLYFFAIVYAFFHPKFVRVYRLKTCAINSDFSSIFFDFHTSYILELDRYLFLELSVKHNSICQHFHQLQLTYSENSFYRIYSNILLQSSISRKQYSLFLHDLMKTFHI